MRRREYLIVGGSAAGMAAAQAIRKLDSAGAIRILSEEPDAPYFRPLIPFLISGKKRAEEMFLRGQGPYQAPGIEVLVNTRVARVDAEHKQVLSTDGQAFGYDRLLIATGSRPHLPASLIGQAAEGVFALRTLADARRAAKRAEQTRQAVMLGGGLLNLKAAYALLERNIAVTLVVYSPEVLSQLMEPDDAALLRQVLEHAGLRIITGAGAQYVVSGEGGVTGVVLDNGAELCCQMVCIGKGVRPNIEWLADSGINLAGGVVVDRRTRTNKAHVFAAGDVAVTYDPISNAPIVTGLWTNAVEMGRCAGANMAGRPTDYGGTFGIMNATQVGSMPFVSMGIVHSSGGEYETYRKSSAGSYRKLVFSADGKTLVGALFVGDISNSGLYRCLIREKTNLNGLKKNVLDHSLHYGHLLRPG